jgi:hypothetical protein
MRPSRRGSAGTAVREWCGVTLARLSAGALLTQAPTCASGRQPENTRLGFKAGAHEKSKVVRSRERRQTSTGTNGIQNPSVCVDGHDQPPYGNSR